MLSISQSRLDAARAAIAAVERALTAQRSADRALALDYLAGHGLRLGTEVTANSGRPYVLSEVAATSAVADDARLSLQFEYYGQAVTGRGQRYGKVVRLWGVTAYGRGFPDTIMVTSRRELPLAAAFGVSADDILTVMDQCGVPCGLGRAEALLSTLDHDAIAAAALQAGCDLDEQTAAAHRAIADMLGVALPPATAAAEEAHARMRVSAQFSAAAPPAK